MTCIFGYDRIRRFWHSKCRKLCFKHYLQKRRLLQAQASNACVVQFPNLPLKKIQDMKTKELYRYCWFAENIQYFNLQLIKYKKNQYLFKNTQFAFFPLEYSFEEYFETVIKSAERALIRKSIKNGYYCKLINYDNHIEEITAINTSKEVRCGRQMSIDYIHPKKRAEIIKPYNPYLYTFGIFSKDGILVAYYMFELITNFFHTVKGIGHNDHLRFGIMNHLFAFSISELKCLKLGNFILYGPISQDEKDGLSKYKRNVGCIGKHIILEGSKRHINNIKYFNKEFKLHGDTNMNFVLDYINQTSTDK